MINDKHPDFQKYKEEFETLLAWRNDEYRKIFIPLPQMKDSPFGKIDKEFALKFNDLKDKYKYLFTE